MKYFQCFLVLIGSLISGFAQSSPTPATDERIPKAPPTAPPIVVNPEAAPDKTPPTANLGNTRYYIGEPTDEEQLYLEYINRSRANPPAEGIRLRDTTDPDVLSAYAFFSVDLNLMVSQFNAISPVPPLSLNSNLTRAARLHSGDMYTNQFQGHTGSTGSTLATRLTAAGYTYSTAGENVYSYAESVWHGHAGFNVDWGPGTGGMQTPPGHRNNIHSSSFKEVGIGVVNGVNGSVGPQLVTQDFGSRSGLTPFVTGVAYYDLNTNGFYDVGEGLGGVRVDVQTGSTYYAITANSGGYSAPVTGNGSYTIIFAATNLADFQTNISIASGANKKVDYILPYTPPSVTGSSNALVGLTNTYTSSLVGGATGYRWRLTQQVPFTLVEGAESGPGNVTNVTLSTTGSYQPVQSTVKAAGIYAFRFAHPAPPTAQYMTLNSPLVVSSTSQLTFYSRLRTATPDQTARVQISNNGGGSWQTVWSQSGTGSPGEGSFTLRNVSLAAFAGQEIRIRFVYDFVSGSYYSQTTDTYGLFIDDISVSNAYQVTNPVVTETSSNSYNFVAGSVGNYVLQVSPKNINRYFPYGPSKTITVVPAPASVSVTSTELLPGNQVRINFQLLSGSASSFQLYKTLNLSSSFAHDASATFQTIVPGSQFRFTTSTGGAGQSYFRVRALP